MPESTLLAVGLAFLMPVGYALIAAGGLDEERARHAALGLLAALGLATLGYLAVGFAFQFGGAGLAYNQPGFAELIWEWSALGVTWGAGWGMIGMAGWGMAGAAATPAAYALALANLPWVATAALIPLISLRGRVPVWAGGLLALLIGAVIYPLAGNWIWGGGWLANLGSNLGQGHGLVDVGGSGLVHLLGAAAALAGLAVFVPRRPYVRSAGPTPLPPVHLPVLAVVGAGFLLAGGPAWALSNPLLDRQMVSPVQMALNMFLAAAGGGVLPLAYTWFVAGSPDPLMAARGVAAGSIVAAAGAPFFPPWAALALGAGVGLLVLLVIYFLDHVARMQDTTAACAVHGLGGGLGLLAVAFFADGRSGVGWNGVGAETYLGVARQGVTGLLAAPGFQPDWPAQFQAQAVGVAALFLFGFFAAWLALVPPAMLRYLLAHRPVLPAVRLPRPAPAPVDAVGQLETPAAEIRSELEPAISPAQLPPDESAA